LQAAEVTPEATEIAGTLHLSVQEPAEPVQPVVRKTKIKIETQPFFIMATKIFLHFCRKAHASKRASTAPGTGIIRSSPKVVYPGILDDMQKSEYSNMANFSRLFNKILVHYENFLG
jgi:hypothetical protein